MTASRTREETVEDYEIFEEIEALQQSELGANGTALPEQGFIQSKNDPTRLVRVYLAETGEPRDVPFWTLEGKNSILRRRNADGSRMFVTKQPEVSEWARGEVKCLLHKDHPERSLLRDMGLGGRTCVAGHLASGYDLDQHMKNKHRKEWAVIQEYRQRQRDDEQREWQRLQAEAARVAIGKKGAA